MIRISTRNFEYDDEKKIKSIPLYAVFCVEKDFKTIIHGLYSCFYLTLCG